MLSVLLILAAVLATVVAQIPAPFSLQLANASVWLSSVAYCDGSTYATHTFTAPNKGFIYSGQFSDKATDMIGFYGYQPNTKQIWVVYRGTDTNRNWLDDAETVPVAGDYATCPSCKVHKGFKKCNDNTITAVTSAVKSLTSQYPGYQLMVTGHSLGAAVATLSALSLKLSGFDPQLYAIASPRVGNTDFANFYGSLFTGDRVPYRLTHYKDVVPHVPLESMTFLHIANEVYEDQNHNLHPCSGNEDSSCGDQWSLIHTDIDDHLLYLNHATECPSS